MKKNTKVQVSPTHKYHPNRIGYFQFLGGPEKNVAVLSESPTESVGSWQGVIYFAVGLQDYQEVA